MHHPHSEKAEEYLPATMQASLRTLHIAITRCMRVKAQRSTLLTALYVQGCPYQAQAPGSYRNVTKSVLDASKDSQKASASGEKKLPSTFKPPCSLSLPLDSKLRMVDPHPAGFSGFALRILGFYNRKSRLIRGARRLYSRISSQVEKPELYASFRLEKNFRTTHAMLVLHMWMCLSRLRAEDEDGIDFGQFLYEIFNHDAEQRVAAAGVKLLLSKWVRELEKMFYGAVVAYDSAMQLEASKDDLPHALWRNVFSEDGLEMPTGSLVVPVQALAEYVRREMACLKLTDKDAILSGNILFTEDFKLPS